MILSTYFCCETRVGLLHPGLLRVRCQEEWRRDHQPLALWSQAHPRALQCARSRLLGHPQAKLCAQLRALTVREECTVKWILTALFCPQTTKIVVNYFSTFWSLLGVSVILQISFSRNRARFAKDMTRYLKQNAVCVINCSWDKGELEKQLPPKMRKDLAEKQVPWPLEKHSIQDQKIGTGKLQFLLVVL